jgi:hypothetical protein
LTVADSKKRTLKKRKSKKSNLPLWGAIGLLALAGAIVYYGMKGTRPHASSMAYFIDEETGEESTRPVNDIPPLLGKGNRASVVREVKYSVDGKVKTAYYYKFTDAMKKKIEGVIAGGGNIGDMDVGPGQLVRSPDPGSKWVNVVSEGGQSVSHIDLSQGKDIQVVVP